MRNSKRRKSAERTVAPVAAGLLVLVALLGLIGTAIKNPRPHDLAVGIAGPAPVVQQIVRGFSSNAPGAFRFTTFATAEAARSAIDQRKVDGALILAEGPPRLIVAGAAGDAVSGAITAALSNAFKAQGQTLAVETVHRYSSGDPHGLILFFVILAILVSTLVAQAVSVLRARAGFTLSLLTVFVFAVLAAVVAMGMASWIAGNYGSGFWLATGLLALATAAVGAVVSGSGRLLGAAGIGLAALIVILLDLVSSGGPLGSQFLPDAYRWLAPGMPVNQLYSALRGALFFDGAGLAVPVAVLSAWLAGGLILMGLAELGARRSRSPLAG
jgi:hypothetical protein